MTENPSICLNLIVRNEAHIIHEMIDSVAPHISYWVIVDTGSNDGTQEIIGKHMAELGIPGELHEREWKNFGHNRTEALQLAQGHADYIWVIDADDLLVGTPDFSHLTADGYCFKLRDPGFEYWREQLFRDGMPWRYEGVLHEYAVCDIPHNTERLRGDFYINSRRLGGRNLNPQKYQHDAEILLAEVERHPDNTRSVFYLAQSYASAGDLTNARTWHARRAEMGGWDEEVYQSLYRLGSLMENLGEPWPDIQDTYLRAWEFRPTRAEPLQAIAVKHTQEQNYNLGYLFAQRAAGIPLPTEDICNVVHDIYTWRALDHKAVCAAHIGKPAESMAINRYLLTLDNLPDTERPRIASNRDSDARRLIEEASTYPSEMISGLPADRLYPKVTVSFGAATEHTLNSFLRCCEDILQIGRFIVFDTGLWPQNRTALLERYPFIELIPCPPGASIAQLRSEIQTRFWLHVAPGWRFFAPERFIGRLTAVLDAEPKVFQVGINLDDATKLTGAYAELNAVRHTENGDRYVLADTASNGPAMFDTERLDLAVEAGLRTATLDEVLCVTET